ncbi:MAG TPA: wax ester/triacylglycerol synthase family O-acyltransferase, partial [Marmoricola sp.]|nr:wax ester/triacylglycerol synthase family O-acyltransferase [Marmoricola sp.]
MTSSSTEIAAQDQLWLHMDRPNNLMIVRALMWLDHEPDWDLVHELLQERLIDRYPVFSQIPVERNGRWHWVPDPEFALDRHLTHRQLDGADQPQLRDLISSEFSEPLPRDQPLWSIQVIHGVRDEDGVARPVLFSS